MGRMKYIDADRLKAEIEKRMHICDGIFERESDTYYQGKAVAYQETLPLIYSLQQEPIEKDEETEKLIVCDIIEATIARINGGKKDEEKEENIMREKIAYLRDLGLKVK